MKRRRTIAPDIAWDMKYLKQEALFGTEPNLFLKSQIWRIPKGGKVLLLGGGEGRNAIYLSSLGYNVTSVDFSRVAVKRASELVKNQKIKPSIIHEDIGIFDIGTSIWDGIISISLHLPLTIREQVYRRCVDGLKNDGVVVIEALEPHEFNFKRIRTINKNNLASMVNFEKYLENLKLERKTSVIQETKEGVGHHGTFRMLQIVGLKQDTDTKDN